MAEQWKPLTYPSFEHYSVSNTGKIRSNDRTFINRTGKMQTIPGRLLKLRSNGIEPHLFCELSFTNFNGKKYRKTVYIHRVVMEHFGEKPVLKRNKFQQYVEHVDDNYANNHIENLRWITWQELYQKQLNNGRVICMDLYKHSPIWQKSNLKPEQISNNK